MAVIDRVEYMDPDGSDGKLLRIVQQFGTWLEERTRRGQQPQSDEMKNIAAMMGKQYEVDPEMAWDTIMRTLQTYQEAIQGLSGGGGNANNPQI